MRKTGFTVNGVLRGMGYTYLVLNGVDEEVVKGIKVMLNWIKSLSISHSDIAK